MARLLPRFLLLLLVLATGIGTLLVAVYRTGYGRFQTDLQTRSERLAQQQAEQLQSLLQESVSDLRYLASDPRLGTEDPATRHEMATTLLLFMRQKQRYDRICFVDRTGREWIGVEFNGGNPAVSPAGQLRDPVRDAFFRAALALKPGEIRHSVLALNLERGDVEVPLKPVLRIATPVTGEDGGPGGLLILSRLAGQLLDGFRHSTRGFPGKAALMNGAGDFFVGFRPEHEWGYMFPGADRTRLSGLYPEVWRAMQRTPSGHLHNAAGLFTFSSFAPLRSDPRGSRWRPLLFVPEERLRTHALEELRPALLIAGTALLLLLPALWMLLWNAETRRRSEARALALGAAIQEERDAFVGGPTVVFKWRNRFGWPVEHVSENVQAVLGFAATSFTTGEITYASIIAPEHLRQFAEETLHACRQGLDRLERAPYQVIDAGGRRRWLQDFTGVVRDGSGQIVHFVGYVNDITPLKEIEQALAHSRDYVQRVLDAIADPTLVVDVASFRLELVNRAAREVYLGPGETTEQMTCHRLSHDRDRPCSGEDEPCPIRRIRETRTNCKVIHRHFTGDGRTIYVEISATPVLDEHGEVSRIIESHRDITRHVEMERELKHLAETDLLTQVHNRLRFNDDLSRAMQRAWDSRTPLALVMLDIDHFKAVNDQHGHDAGDRILQAFTRHVRGHIRRSDILARWGGEEFVLLLPDTALGNAGTISEHLRQSVAEQPFPPVGRITASFGVTALRPGDTPESLIKRADEALYRSKNAGRNRSTMYEPPDAT